MATGRKIKARRDYFPVKFLGNLTLGTRILLLTALGLLVGAGLLSYPGLKATNEATQMMLEDRLTTAHLTADYLDQSLKLCMDILQEIAQGINTSSEPASLEIAAESLRSSYDQLSIRTDSVYLTDSAGQLTWMSPAVAGGPLVNTVQPVTDATITTTGHSPSISALVSSPASNSPVILFACRTGMNGTGGGTLLAAIDLAQSGSVGFVRPMRLGETGYVEVVDQTGIVVVRTEPGPRQAPFEKSDHSGHFSELISTGKPTMGLCHTCHESGGEVTNRDVLAFVPLTAARWGVVIRQSEKEALAPVRKLRVELILSAAGLIAIAFALAMVTTRDIVNRLRTLTTASSRIAEGDFDSRVISSRHDEVGTLAQTLESMRSRLKTSYAEIERRSNELSSLLSVSEILAALPGFTDLTSALGSALDRTLEITQMDAGGLLLWTEEKQTFNYLVYRGFPNGYAEKAVATGDGTYFVNQSRVIPDASATTDSPLTAGLKSAGFNSVALIPLQPGQRAPGMIVLAGKAPQEFPAENIRLVEGIARHIATALENARLHRELQHKEEMRGKLLEGIFTVQEEERRRIARELHDETCQVLASLNANLQAAIAVLGDDSDKAEALLKKVQSMSVNILDNINKLIYQLRPSLLDDLGLLAGIRWLGENVLSPAGVSLKLTTSGRRRRLQREVETALFRVVQEAFNNVARHAHATRVEVAFGFAPEMLNIELSDDGAGFDVNEALPTAAQPRGLGLLGMTERIELIGGKITFESGPAAGTHIHIEIPRGKEAHNGKDKNTHSR